MSAHNLTDFELVKQFIEGQQSAIEILITRHKERVYTYIFFKVKNEHLADDLFQEAFIKVMNSLQKGKYKDDSKFVPWVLRIAHNLIIDHYRVEKRMRNVSNDEKDYDLFNSSKFSEPNIESDMIKTQTQDEVRELIEKLSEDQKQMVVLRHFVGMSFKDIAEELDISINTALGRMRYALKNLRKHAEEKKIVLMDY